MCKVGKKMKRNGVFISFLFCFVLAGCLFAQIQKPPEVYDDFAETIQGGRVSIPVLENDICMEGHEMEIFLVSSSSFAEIQIADSTIIYIMEYTHPTQYPSSDLITYAVRDINNGLVSEYAYIHITIHETGFDLAKDSLTINNYNISFTTFGNYFYDYYNSSQSLFEIPEGSGLHTLNKSNLLIGARKEYAKFSVGENIFSQLLSDFWPGPYSASSSYLLLEDSTWNYVWKITREDINFHLSNWFNPDYEPIEEILSWPGNGNQNFNYHEKIAPFYDKNLNEVYEPFLGDYPAIRGDEAIFSIYNDHRTCGVSTFSNSMGLEVHQLSYAFDCSFDSAFYNTFFIQYTIINRSDNDYTDVLAGVKTIFYIGNYGDDYVGCDTLLDCYFGYNDSIDEQSGEILAYGDYPPAQAICYLNQNLYAFIGPADHYSVFGPGPYYNALSGLWGIYGEPMTYGGNGQGGTDTTTFLYPGNPSDPEDWSNIQSNPTQGVYNSCVGSVGPFALNSGDTIVLDIAYIFARDYGGTNLSSVSLLKERIETIKWYYDNDSTPCGATWSGIRKKEDPDQSCSIFPNPVNDLLFVKTSYSTQDLRYEIYNTVGQHIQKGYLTNSDNGIDVNSLNNGFYLISIKTKNEYFTRKFIKY